MLHLVCCDYIVSSYASSIEFKTSTSNNIRITLHWRHSDYDGVSNHQHHVCLLNRLFRRRSKKISKLRVTGLCVGNSPGPVNSTHKGPVTRKMFPLDDVIMKLFALITLSVWFLDLDVNWPKIHCLICTGILIINLRQSSDILRFIMGISIPISRRLFGKYTPELPWNLEHGWIITAAIYMNIITYSHTNLWLTLWVK